MLRILGFYDFPLEAESSKFYQTKIDILKKQDGKGIYHIKIKNTSLPQGHREIYKLSQIQEKLKVFLATLLS